jgi:EAL domain
MDEPVLVAERPHDETWMDNLPVAEGNLDFSPQCSDVQPLTDSSFDLELDLADALRLRALRVEYQPQFDLGSGRGCGVEALARWVRPTGEVMAPSVFIDSQARRVGPPFSVCDGSHLVQPPHAADDLVGQRLSTSNR